MNFVRPVETIEVKEETKEEKFNPAGDSDDCDSPFVPQVQRQRKMTQKALPSEQNGAATRNIRKNRQS